MSEDNNKLEKATFILIYDREIDTVTVTRRKAGALDLGENTREASTVQACIETHYCFERRALMIERTVRNTEYWKLPWAPERKLEIVGGLTISDAVEEVVTRANEWRDEVTALVNENAPGGKLQEGNEEPAAEGEVNSVTLSANGKSVTMSAKNVADATRKIEGVVKKIKASKGGR